MSKVFNRTVRKWIYGLLLAGFPVACFYFPDLIPAAPLWLALALAALNLTPSDVAEKDDVLASLAGLSDSEREASIQAAAARKGY
ncbi:hypothetical protein LVJ59_17440 [Microbacterium sp. KKR3/1]|uniref:hypothetical protein n=1 Tax=Microbacterium sp. KKR3/1 TaxID=2904241 RepID=UPI001E599FEA|nr:hypothetical protein [Microbacterium sp. KKR3/1]MCE0510835.1 hypothetical protein [Microbacterium sp. KKR3/1]